MSSDARVAPGGHRKRMRAALRLRSHLVGILADRHTASCFARSLLLFVKLIQCIPGLTLALQVLVEIFLQTSLAGTSTPPRLKPTTPGYLL